MLIQTLFIAAALTSAAAPDTLQAASVYADRGIIVSRQDTVIISQGSDITGALLQLPTLTVSDYGGEASVKSVSFRGLGAANTVIYIDGIRVDNIQSGQIDLGMLDMAGFASIVADYAQNSLSFNTAVPAFRTGGASGRISFGAGSFGTYEPSARVSVRLGRGSFLSANGSLLRSDGFRENSDILRLRGGYELGGTLDRGRWMVKSALNASDRGTPGSISYPSSDRQQDKNLYWQGSLRYTFTPFYTMNLGLRYAADDMHYASLWGDSDYDSDEWSLSSAHEFSIGRHWKVSVSETDSYISLRSGNYDRAARFTTLKNIAGAMEYGRFSARAAVEYNGVFDKGGARLHNFSPSAGLRYIPGRGWELSAYGRRAFRAPVFNELYYIGFGNPELRPEDAWLSGAGITWNSGTLGRWTLSADANIFYNHMKDKIISAPSEADPYIWLPYNIGTVKSAGADASAGVQYSSGTLSWHFRAAYSYQDSRDMTEGSGTYGEQIPFVARHSLTLSTGAQLHGWTLSAVWNFRSGRNDSSGAMPSWDSLDASLSKAFGLVTLSLKGRNLLDRQYEIIRDYPVPGRAITVGAEINF